MPSCFSLQLGGIWEDSAKPLAESRSRPRALLSLRTNVRFKDQHHRPADRRRRPSNRLRNPRRVRARARWENSPGLRRPCTGHAPAPHPVADASQRPQRQLQPRRGIRPLQNPPHPPRPAGLELHHQSLRGDLRAIPRSAPGEGAVARRSRSKRSVAGEGRRVAALRKPLDGDVARRLSGAAARAISRRGPLKEEPAATYSPRGLPPKYHRR
jgi:hypothetical protein